MISVVIDNGLRFIVNECLGAICSSDYSLSYSVFADRAPAARFLRSITSHATPEHFGGGV